MHLTSLCEMMCHSCWCKNIASLVLLDSLFLITMHIELIYAKAFRLEYEAPIYVLGLHGIAEDLRASIFLADGSFFILFVT